MSADNRQLLKYFSLPHTSKLRLYWLTAVTNFLGKSYAISFFSEFSSLSEIHKNIVLMAQWARLLSVSVPLIRLWIFLNVEAKRKHKEETWAHILTALTTLNFSLSSLALACGKATWLRSLMGINTPWRDGFVREWKWTENGKQKRKERGPQADLI